MHGCTRLLKALVTAAGLASLAILAGCPGDSTAPTLASATSRYDAGQYELALSESESVISRGPSSDRAQADLVAGMAAFQLDRFVEAERHLTAAERSGAPAIRGRARVMLANMRLEQGRTADAAALFDSGAGDLTGADADKARRYASLARDGQLGSGQPSGALAAAEPVKPGSHAAAKVASAPAASAPAAAASSAPAARATPAKEAAPAPSTKSAASTAALASAPATGNTAAARTPPASRASAAAAAEASTAATGVFTVRAGAYTTEAAARRRLNALAADVRRAKSPLPHIAPVTTKDGDTLYAVRIGSFRSRAEAEALLKRLARKDLAVGAL